MWPKTENNRRAKKQAMIPRSPSQFPQLQHLGKIDGGSNTEDVTPIPKIPISWRNRWRIEYRRCDPNSNSSAKPAWDRISKM